MKKGLLILVVSVALVTCKKHEDPAPKTTVLTFRQDNTGLLTTFSDDYIFVTDEAGAMLDNQAFESGTTITLATSKTLPTQKINVTIFRKESAGLTWVRTFLGIPVGQTWQYLVPGASGQGASTGIALLTINHQPPSPPGAVLILTDATGNSLADTESSTPSGDVKVAIPLYKTPTRVCIASTRNNQPTLLTLNNISPGADLTANFNTDFKVLDHLVDISFSEPNTIFGISAVVQGLDANSSDIFPAGNSLCSRYLTNSPGPITIGYNDGFPAFKTEISIFGSKFSKTYFKIGNAAMTAPLLNYTMSVTNNTIGGFAFAISGGYNLRRSLWAGSNSTTTWEVYSSPEGKQLIPSLPDELKNKYGSLNLLQLPYQYSEFTFFLDGFTYEKFLLRGITGPWTKGSTEYQKIQFGK